MLTRRWTIKGLSLPEMIVAMLILSSFLVMAIGTIIPGFKITQQAEQSISAQRQVVLTFDRLVAEMSQMDRASVSTNTGVLSYLSDQSLAAGNTAPVADDDLLDLAYASPEREWLKHVVLRHREGHLWRQEYDYEKGLAVYPIDPDSLPVLADTPGVAEKIFCKNVEAFEALPTGMSRVQVTIRCVYRQAEHPTAAEATMQIHMRGGL